MKKKISSGEPACSLLSLSDLSNFVRNVGIPAPQHVVSYQYFVWLCSRVGLNGPDPTQQYRTEETDDKTYFELAYRLHSTSFKAISERDNNRISDAKLLRNRFALVCSSFTNYDGIDTMGASMLEVLVALCERFDSEAMMDESGEERSKKWFWLLMKNAKLDKYVDSSFQGLSNDNDETCRNIIKRINDRNYEPDGTGGFFPLNKTKYDQRLRELWYQIHEYFVENGIE